MGSAARRALLIHAATRRSALEVELRRPEGAEFDDVDEEE